MKKILFTTMAAIMILSNNLTAFAAPETMPDGTIFDAEYYAQNNPDVVAAYGTDKYALFNHYTSFGQAEGRMAYADSNAVDNTSLNGNVIIQTKQAPDGRIFTVTFTDDEPEYVFKVFPPNNGEDYEVGEVMTVNKYGNVGTWGGVFDSSDF